MQDEDRSYGLCSGATITPNQWHHVAISIPDWKLFVDGTPADETSVSDDSILKFCPNEIGESNPTLTLGNYNWIVAASNGFQGNGMGLQGSATDIRGHFDGYIDELRFRSVVFTAAEAAAVSNAGY